MSTQLPPPKYGTLIIIAIALIPILIITLLLSVSYIPPNYYGYDGKTIYKGETRILHPPLSRFDIFNPHETIMFEDAHTDNPVYIMPSSDNYAIKVYISGVSFKINPYIFFKNYNGNLTLLRTSLHNDMANHIAPRVKTFSANDIAMGKVFIKDTESWFWSTHPYLTTDNSFIDINGIAPQYFYDLHACDGYEMLCAQMDSLGIPEGENEPIKSTEIWNLPDNIPYYISTYEEIHRLEREDQYIKEESTYTTISPQNAPISSDIIYTEIPTNPDGSVTSEYIESALAK